MKCPCITCALNGCGVHHNKCVRYKAWKDELAKRNKILRDEKVNSDVMSDAQKRHCWRNKRYGRNQPLNRSTKER